MSRLPENPWGAVKAAQSEKRPAAQKKQQKSKNVSSNATTTADAMAKKFQEAQSKHIEAAKKHIANYESSSDEEELASASLLDSVFKGYGGDKTELQKTQQFLENVFQSGTAICLICIATVKQKDFVSFKHSFQSLLIETNAISFSLDMVMRTLLQLFSLGLHSTLGQ